MLKDTRIHWVLEYRMDQSDSDYRRIKGDDFWTMRYERFAIAMFMRTVLKAC